MTNFEDSTKQTVLVFCVSGKRQTHFGVNAMVLDSIFLNTKWLYSVRVKREEFETGNLRIVFIDVETENNLGLR